MRYTRNVKIFRGGVDAAPFASLFFLLVLFTLLFYSHVFFPGVPIQLADQEEPPEMETRSVKVGASGTIHFLGSSYNLAEFKRELQSRAQRGTLPRRLLITAELGANSSTVATVEDLLKGSGIALKLPGARLELPDYAGFAGARNPVVVVGINLNGQLFFQQQLVSEKTLLGKLAAAANHTPEPITLLLQADKNVPVGAIIRLLEIARRAHVAHVTLNTKPGSP